MTKPQLTRRAFGGLALASALSPLLASMARAQDGLKVAFVVHGTLGDKSFFDSAAEGLHRAEGELGIELSIIEAGLDRGRWQPALADAVDQGFDVVIAGTWEMSGYVTELAVDYPDTKFIIFDDAPDFSNGDLGNVMAILYRVSTASYLAGYVAAKVSKTGKIGTIIGLEGATLLEFSDNFEKGAKAANPDVDVTLAVAGTFTDPAKGKELALAQFAQGVDVIFPAAGATGIGALQAARDEGKLAIGVDNDQYAVFLEADPAQAAAIVTSVEKRVGNSLVTVLKQIIDGEAEFGTTTILGLSEGAVAISENANYEALVPADVRAEVEAVKAQLISGEITL